MTKAVTTGVNLEGLDQAFRLLGMQEGMTLLRSRIADYYLETDPAIAAFLKEMEQYDKPRLQGSPSSDHNKERVDDPKLNYFGPQKSLQVMLSGDWFNEICANKEKYTKAWREKLITDLMKSEYRDYIAREWDNPDHRLYIRGYVIGGLLRAGVFLTKSALKIARIYYGTREENTKDVNTLAKYMGNKKEYFIDWIEDYIKNPPIEKQ